MSYLYLRDGLQLGPDITSMVIEVTLCSIPSEDETFFFKLSVKELIKTLQKITCHFVTFFSLFVQFWLIGIFHSFRLFEHESPLIENE